jgi:hypothetical protein
MHVACPLTALAPGEAVRLDTSPPIAVFHMEDGELLPWTTSAPVGTRRSTPNLPPGPTITGHI